MNMKFDVYSPRALAPLSVYASTPDRAFQAASELLDILESADRVDEMRDQYTAPRARTTTLQERSDRDLWLALNVEHVCVEEGLVPEGCR